jgi:hypothetical protein
VSKGLALLGSAGLVRRASEPATVDRTLPVAPELARLFPAGGLRRGSTVAVRGGEHPGATSLLLALVAEASAAGSWCAVVGMPSLGLVAAAEAGIAVARFPLVPRPGPDWPGVVAALLDGLDVVVVATPGQVPAGVRTRLAARARQRGSVLVPCGRWDGADLTLSVTGGAWHGPEQGRGRLMWREQEVVAYGRGAAAQVRRTTITIPRTEAPRTEAPRVDVPAVDPMELAG